MRSLALVLVLVPTGMAGAMPAFAQNAAVDSLNTPAAVRCSALGELDEGELPTAVAYLAGYGDGQRDATTLATVGTTDQLAAGTPEPGVDDAAEAEEQEPPATEAEAGGSPQVPPAGGPPAAILPTISVDAIIAACAQSPDSRVIDIITAQGGMDNS